MGWNHIPFFEADFGEPDKSNNPWKGKVPKRPAHVSVAMPLDDWLCQKLERLNTTVAEGYPSRSRDSGRLKKDQYIKMPKTQAHWYQMHTIRPDTPHRPGKSVFSWRHTEAKVNSQFPRITKAAAYPPTGPVFIGQLVRSTCVDGKEMLRRAAILLIRLWASIGVPVSCRTVWPKV